MSVRLRTERLLLRPLGRGDLESTHAYASDGDNARYMLFLPNDTVAETEAFLQRVSDEWAKEKPVSYEFAVVRDGEHIGAVSVELMEDGISAEMGWVFRRDCQKQGYAYEAALAVRNFAIQKLGVERVFAQCDARNLPSQRLMQKLCMRLEDAQGVRVYPQTGEEAQELTYAIRVE